ncbi:MAG: NADH:ubiquinone reductase (Na(+)-transporting) subunit F [Desulfobacterales bacterium]
MIYLVSIGVFSGIILILVLLLLFVETRIVKKGDRQIIVNEDEDNPLTVPMGTNLLSALNKNSIYLPSACGGSGSCGLCKCKVLAGGGEILPTELPHLSRQEKAENIRLSCQLKIREDLKIEIPPEIFSIKKFTGTVASNKNIGTFIKELVVDLDEPVEFDAGIYMQIDIPEYSISFSEFEIDEPFKATWDYYNLWDLTAANDEPIFRAYSAANPPADNQRMMFNVRIATPPPDLPDAPPGVGSSYIFSLKPGDRVSMSGPFGEFKVKESEREMCFVGGGAGMAPMRSHLRHQLLTLNTRRKATFWYGARNRMEMLYDEEFRALDQQFDNFSYHVALSDPLPDDEWNGMVGFIHQCLLDRYLQDHPDPTEVEYYLCGPPPMIAAMKNMLDSLGVEPEMIAYDEFS